VQQPFEDAAALLKFLEADEPERYVFRGQTRAYEGPMLPSGFRDRFTPFDASTGSLKWAGVSTSESVIKEQADIRRRDVTTKMGTGEDIGDGNTTWDLLEAAYQTGFRVFFDQPHRQQIRDVSNVLRESAIPAMGALFGTDLADFLCQQYGFTSIALDVSTDASVALFFATHQAPFYHMVNDSPHLGVVYRWPRQRAATAQDLLVPLEGSNFESIRTSFRNFVHGSEDLNIVTDTLMRYTYPTGAPDQKRMMAIVSEGERRRFGALCFPFGALDRSRMGRQRAALLWPDSEVVEGLDHRRPGDRAVLVGDLLKTHQGETFRFRHASAGLPERLNKFALWPSIRPTAESPTADFRFELPQNDIEFEDLYLELMLRFFSSCCPVDILMATLRDPTNRKSLHGIGPIQGVVDLGYLLHPSDACLIAGRLRTPGIYTPIPTLRHISAEHVKSFQAAFAGAIAS
jgi:hypothetical protein